MACSKPSVRWLRSLLEGCVINLMLTSKLFSSRRYRTWTVWPSVVILQEIGHLREVGHVRAVDGQNQITPVPSRPVGPVAGRMLPSARR